MKKMHFILIAIIVIISIVLGFFLYKNIEIENDDWLNDYPGKQNEVEIVFNDVPKNHEFSEYIKYLTEREIMFPSGDGYFYPEEKVSLGEFSEILLRASMPRLNTQSYVQSDYIKKFEEIGILKEKEINENNFNSMVTNYQVGVLLAKVDIKVRNNRQCMGNINFEDLYGMSEVAQSLIIHSVERGFFDLKNSKNFYPYKPLTRAEVAKIIYLFVNN